jgi:hypothetical protein
MEAEKFAEKFVIKLLNGRRPTQVEIRDMIIAVQEMPKLKVKMNIVQPGLYTFAVISSVNDGRQYWSLLVEKNNEEFMGFDYYPYLRGGKKSPRRRRY